MEPAHLTPIRSGPKWRQLVDDARTTGTTTTRMDNPTLEFLFSTERRLRSGCPDLLDDQSDVDTDPSPDASTAGEEPVKFGDLIAILASIPIDQLTTRDDRLTAIVDAGLQAFVLDSREWEALGDPYWVIAIGPADEQYLGEDCAVIEEEYGRLIDGCEPRRL